MVAVGVLGLASLTGLIWTVTTDSKPIEQVQTSQTAIEAPARLLIDLNTADPRQLQLLPNIGPKLAQRIYDDRTENGSFETLKDLDRVKGIGPKTIAHLSDWVTITTP